MIIKVSLTTFMSYLNSSGFSRIRTVQKALEESLEDYEAFKDYWFKFKNKVIFVHKNGLGEDELRKVIDDVPEDRQLNYKTMVDGYCKFWNRKKKSVWVKPIHKTWCKGNLHISINPEVCLEYKGRVYLIKMSVHVDETMNRKQADLITWLMRNSLGENVPDKLVCCVLDVKKGTLYEERPCDPSVKVLIEAEARSFLDLWKNL